MNSLLFVTLLLLSVSHASALCTSAKQIACLTKFDGLQNLFTGTRIFTNEQLSKSCSSLSDVNNCITETGCTDTDPRAQGWTFQKSAFGYICGDGRAAFLRNQDCFESYNSLILTGGCKPYKTKPDLVCESFSSMLTCIRLTVANLCNADAADFFVAYIAAQAEPMVLKLAPECILLAPGESHSVQKEVEMSRQRTLIVANQSNTNAKSLTLTGVVLIPVSGSIALAIVVLAIHHSVRRKPPKDGLTLNLIDTKSNEDLPKPKLSPTFSKTSFAPRFYVKNRQSQSLN